MYLNLNGSDLLPNHYEYKGLVEAPFKPRVWFMSNYVPWATVAIQNI